MSPAVPALPPAATDPVAGMHDAWRALALLAAFALGADAAVTGGPYVIAPMTIDAGGHAAAAGPYDQWAGGLGAIGGRGAGGVYANRTGYVAQLPDHGLLRLAASAYTVDESAGTLAITVLRSGGSEGAVSAAFSCAGGTATPGADFIPGAGTVSFADGQTSATILLAIVADGITEGPESATLTLGTPTGGAVLGAPASATIVIRDPAPAALPSARPRIVSEAQLWSVAGQPWIYDVVVDAQQLQPAHALVTTYDLTFALQGPPAGMTIVKTGATTARVTWTAAGVGRHLRATVRVTDRASGTSDQQEVLLYVIAVPSAGG